MHLHKNTACFSTVLAKDAKFYSGLIYVFFDMESPDMMLAEERHRSVKKCPRDAVLPAFDTKLAQFRQNTHIFKKAMTCDFWHLYRQLYSPLVRFFEVALGMQLSSILATLPPLIHVSRRKSSNQTHHLHHLHLHPHQQTSSSPSPAVLALPASASLPPLVEEAMKRGAAFSPDSTTTTTTTTKVL